MRKRNKNQSRAFLTSFFLLIGISFVFATAPIWQGQDVVYNTSEEAHYYHDLRMNITGYNNDVAFAFDTENNINWTNSTGVYSVTPASVSAWIAILNSTTGNFSINATYDNQTGFFIIPIQATNTTGQTAATTETFEFQVNATNDAPNFTNINSSYNLTQDQEFLEYLNASDEESHYPLAFNISFISNCTHASWSERNPGENCSILNATDIGSNISTLMNFTPGLNDVGVYWANISVMDAGENYNCPHIYCDNSTYEQNKTTYYSQIVEFTVFSSLTINVSDCEDKVFQEGTEGTCWVNITTKGTDSNLTISSNASLRNYQTPSWANRSWFYSTNNTNAANYTISVLINVTPQRTEIGNWTINFSVVDNEYLENDSALIYIYVNKTTNTLPDLNSISELNTSINAGTTINLTAYDNGFMIPDKNETYGGYNESLNFTVNIYNQTTLASETLSNFTVSIINMPVSGTNETNAQIVFTPNESEVGNYTINISIEDQEGNLDYSVFNLSIFANNYPQWDGLLNSTLLIYEDNSTYLNLSQNVSDADGDALTFSYVSDTSFASFDVNPSTGIIDFTPIDVDVGQHLVNITVSDGYLTNTTQFNFTVLNVHDNPNFTSVACNNASSCNSTRVVVMEDSFLGINVQISDQDLLIPSGQKSFYNESLSAINTTIVNATTGASTSLFNFSYSLDLGTGTWVYTGSFVAANTQVGIYNATFYFNDSNGTLGNWSFVLEVIALNDRPDLFGASTNKTTIANETFYFDFNATDEEDLNESGGAMHFNWTFLEGTDFINSDETIFNTTSGVLNFTFNESTAGKYHVNLSVNDSSGARDYEDFWIYVYGTPTILSPSSGGVFNLTEHSPYLFNFSANHSVQDTLIFEYWIDSINCSYQNSSDCTYNSVVLRNSTSGYGNSTNTSWNFTPNYTDETYGQLKNLTVSVYSNSTDLTDEQRVNITLNTTFKLNISHTNCPITFSGDIPDLGPVSYGNIINLALSDYFTDSDYTDSYYQEDVNFTIVSNGTLITATESNWTVNFTGDTNAVITESFNITGTDSLGSNISNNFLVKFTTSTTSVVTTSVGSTTTTKTVPISLRIILPGPVTAYQKDTLVLPITLENDGKQGLTGINLTSQVFKDSILRSDFNITFNESYISSLPVGASRNLTMTVEIDTLSEGIFELNINATSQTPKYSDWGKIYLTINKTTEFEEKILFADNFILENPECAELTEIINEAKKLLQQGEPEQALLKATEAVDACKKIVSSTGKFHLLSPNETSLYQTLFYLMLSFVIGLVLYYYYRRIKLKMILEEHKI